MIDLIIDSETIAAANASSNFLWDVPETAAMKGDHTKPNGKATWSEVVEVSGVEMAREDDGAVRVVLSFTVPADATSVNIGKPAHKEWYRVNPEAFRNKEHAAYKKNNFAISKLNALIRAVGFDLAHGESVNYGQYFGADEGERAVVVGQRCVAYIEKSWYEGKPRCQVRDYQSYAEAHS